MARSAADRKAEAARHREITENAYRNLTGEKAIPVVSLEVCEYRKDKRVLLMSDSHIGMPLTFFVKSHYTGKEVRFIPVKPTDVLFDPDQWDGEQQIYRPLHSIPGVDHMVIHRY